MIKVTFGMNPLDDEPAGAIDLFTLDFTPYNSSLIAFENLLLIAEQVLKREKKSCFYLCIVKTETDALAQDFTPDQHGRAYEVFPPDRSGQTIKPEIEEIIHYIEYNGSTLDPKPATIERKHLMPAKKTAEESAQQVESAETPAVDHPASVKFALYTKTGVRLDFWLPQGFDEAEFMNFVGSAAAAVDTIVGSPEGLLAGDPKVAAGQSRSDSYNASRPQGGGDNNANSPAFFIQGVNRISKAGKPYQSVEFFGKKQDGNPADNPFAFGLWGQVKPLLVAAGYDADDLGQMLGQAGKHRLPIPVIVSKSKKDDKGHSDITDLTPVDSGGNPVAKKESESANNPTW